MQLVWFTNGHSQEYLTNINIKVLATEPSISLTLWTESYHWTKASKSVKGIQEETTRIYYLPATENISISEADLKQFKDSRYTTFKQFTKHFNIYKYEIENEKLEIKNWRSATCNCEGNLKNYICKHVVGMGMILKLVKPPPAAKDVPLGEKRKRGRPAKSKKARIVQ